jgi:Helix-turn-helix of DDE superfamily endonuclease
MRYDCLKEFKDEEFRRLTGEKRPIFEKMVCILKEAEFSKKLLGGRPHKLSIEDQLLMALEYIREYRTYFHVAASYQVSESACYRNIRWDRRCAN